MIRSLHTWLGPGWLGENFGYYIHQGRLYVTGIIETDQEYGEHGRPAPGTVILKELPSALRPASPQRIILPAWAPRTDDPRNHALQLPRLHGSTVFPNGEWILDHLPSQVITTPPEAEWHYYFEGVKYPQYRFPLLLALVTGNAHWDLSTVPDTYSEKSLEGHVDTANFSAPSAAYVRHGSRVHLDGAATRSENDEGGVTRLFKTGEGVPPGSEMSSLVNHEDYSTALLGGEPWPLEITASPEIFFVGEGSDAVNSVGEDAPISAFSGFGQHTAYAGGAGHTLTNASLAAPPVYQDPKEGRKTVHKKRRTTSTFECPEFGGGSTSCNGLTTLPVVSFNPFSSLVEIRPHPDWYCIVFRVGPFTVGNAFEGGSEDFLSPFPPNPENFRGSGGCEPIGLGKGGGCKLNLLEDISNTNVGPSTSFYSLDPAIGGVAVTDVTGPMGPGTVTMSRTFVAKPGSVPYKGDPQLAVASVEGIEAHEIKNYLFKGDAAPPTITVTWPGEGIHSFACAAEFRVIPFYSRRQWGMHAGDILDLSKTGYPSRGRRVGTTEIGPTAQGLVRKPEVIVP